MERKLTDETGSDMPCMQNHRFRAGLTTSLFLLLCHQVSYLLLVFFTGMFITLDGFNSTGIPDTIWDMMEAHARIGDPSGVVVLTLVVLLLSNIASNVPTGKEMLLLSVQIVYNNKLIA
jgi:Na+/H+ antiporter NhaD/arsenite permease-like protein